MMDPNRGRHTEGTYVLFIQMFRLKELIAMFQINHTFCLYLTWAQTTNCLPMGKNVNLIRHRSRMVNPEVHNKILKNGMVKAIPVENTS